MDLKTEELKYDTIGDDEISAFLSVPEDGKKHPGIVLIHEIFGLDEYIKDVAKRLSTQGYVVLAPDLFTSKKLSQVITKEGIMKTMNFIMSIPPEKQRDEAYRSEQMAKMSPEDQKAISGVYQTLFMNRPTELLTQYLSSAVDFLNQHQSVNGKIGSIGFCFGGGMSISLGCTGKVDAVVIFYGENPDPIEKAKNVKNAVLGLYAGEDTRITSKAHELFRVLAEVKKPTTMKIYPNAYHAFFNNTRPQIYNEKAAKDAWDMVIDFFRDNLQ
ncbi:dienelactone hydrolase family protein [Candidatus Marsarchaeota archaeon]|jgi:carboxymethylenebutenolidase|nr:dienelactone hydrolase family protein [Candidatus Marsarchaeota archaeon]